MNKFKRKEIGLVGVEAKIVYHQFKGLAVKTFLVTFGSKRRVLSTLEGRFRWTKTIGNHYNPPPLWPLVHKERKKYVKKICTDLGYARKDIVMLLTGVNMDNISIKTESYDNFKVYACVTAGARGNAQRIGVDKPGSVEIGEYVFKKLGTVNIILMTNFQLSGRAMLRSLITITEAKTIAFQDLNIRSSYTPKIQASGTGTDNIMVVSGVDSPKISYTGGHCKAGELIAKAVTSAVKEALLRPDKNC